MGSKANLYKENNTMPIKLSDTYTCDKCGKIFDWYYFELIRQNINSPQFLVETIPQAKTLVHSCQEIDNNIFKIGVNCPYCSFDNHFSFIK